MPLIGVELILIYFFRVTLKHYYSLQTQIMQLDFRYFLCQFIGAYSEYSRKINVIFRIKNMSWRNFFIPISDERGNKYHSFIKVSSPTNYNVIAGAYYWQNKSMLNSGDSISICVRLMELQLRDLGVYNLPSKDVIKDLKENNCLIPKLKFYISQNVKYIYQEPEGMCGI